MESARHIFYAVDPSYEAWPNSPAGAPAAWLPTAKPNSLSRVAGCDFGVDLLGNQRNDVSLTLEQLVDDQRLDEDRMLVNEARAETRLVYQRTEQIKV